MNVRTRIVIACAASAVLMTSLIVTTTGGGRAAPTAPARSPIPPRAEAPATPESRAAPSGLEGEIAALRRRVREQEEEIGKLSRRISELDAGEAKPPEASALPAPDLDSLLMARRESIGFGPGEEPPDASLNAAAAAFQARGDAGKDLLLAELEHVDPERRATAAFVAARLEGEDLVEPLARSALEDDDREVRNAAARALSSMNCPAAAGGLLDLVGSPDADPAARLSAWSGLARLGREEAWSAFEAVLASAEGEITREMVVEAALEHEDEHLLEPLRRVSEDMNLAQPVRAKVLARIGEAR